jgi:hypothetical protein
MTPKRHALTQDDYRRLLAEGMTEDTLQRQVEALARGLGWRVFHVRWSVGTTPGWPDCTMIHTVQRRLMWRELKTTRGRVSADQRSWIKDLTAAGCDAGIWRPIDLLDGTIQHQLTHHPHTGDPHDSSL